MPVQTVEREALLAARGDANILIVGERGPGQAALARFIHEQSDRSSDGFSVVKCGRLSDEIIRFQLFGHLEDSADSDGLETPGLLTSPFCGTVFLDEVGSLGAATQARVLRYLEVSEAGQPVRFISSTTVNLKAQVAAGLFLPDLYDRLNARTLVVPGASSRLRPSGYGEQANVDRLESIVRRPWAWLTAMRSSS